jgi:hypothetical protein
MHRNKIRALAVVVGIFIATGLGVYAVRTFAIGSRASEVAASEAVYTVAQPGHVANQDGNTVTLGNASTGWFGTAKNPRESYFGMYFTGASIPANAVITSAKIRFTSSQEQWISTTATVAVENTAAPKDFSTEKPKKKWESGRMISQSAYANNTRWTSGQSDDTTSIDVKAHIDAVRKLKGRAENAPVLFVIRGTGSAWNRKFVYNKGATGPRLIVTYVIPGQTATATPMPTAVPPTAVPTVASSPTPATPTPTGAGTNAPSPTGHAHTPSQGDSHAMNRWTPNPKYDYCVDRNGVKIGATEAEATAYVKKIHESFYVIGPDGKKYPTWHPPVYTNPQTGEKCTFGHEHGRDPKLSEVWKTKQVQQYFYFDANGNGTMDSAEEAVTGLPFGYVNEQMSAYYQALGQNVMRHEDHVGHKVDWANGEGDMATHQMSTSVTGGVWVGRTGDGVIAKDTGARCYYLAKPHQGTSTPDAFTNNLHEVFYFVDCRHPDPKNNQKVSIAVMEGFGKPGGFTSFMPLCGVQRRSDPQDFVNIGTTDANNQYPGGDGDREIITRECIEKGFLVPQGSWSGNMYEAWPANLSVETADGRKLATGVNLLFDVEDANRYYYPESVKAARGYKNPDAGTNLGFTMDLCYDTSLSSQGRKYRGGPCDWSTDYGKIRDIAWNDPRSGFKGVNRGMYFKPPVLDNANGPEVWYTDPYGYNAKTSPFPGSVKQQVSAKKLDYATLIGDSIDPRVNNRRHDDGGGTVHAPN